jgi:hypothetical protein
MAILKSQVQEQIDALENGEHRSILGVFLLIMVHRYEDGRIPTTRRDYC